MVLSSFTMKTFAVMLLLKIVLSSDSPQLANTYSIECGNMKASKTKNGTTRLCSCSFNVFSGYSYYVDACDCGGGALRLSVEDRYYNPVNFTTDYSLCASNCPTLQFDGPSLGSTTYRVFQGCSGSSTCYSKISIHVSSTFSHHKLGSLSTTTYGSAADSSRQLTLRRQPTSTYSDLSTLSPDLADTSIYTGSTSCPADTGTVVIAAIVSAIILTLCFLFCVTTCFVLCLCPSVIPILYHGGRSRAHAALAVAPAVVVVTPPTATVATVTTVTIEPLNQDGNYSSQQPQYQPMQYPPMMNFGSPSNGSNPSDNGGNTIASSIRRGLFSPKPAATAYSALSSPNNLAVAEPQQPPLAQAIAVPFSYNI